MIEVLVSLLILTVGLLGVAGLQARMQTAEIEAFQRAQAIVLLQDMVERVHLHRVTASCFRFTTNTTNGSPYLGEGSGNAPTCSALTATPIALNVPVALKPVTPAAESVRIGPALIALTRMPRGPRSAAR